MQRDHQVADRYMFVVGKYSVSNSHTASQNVSYVVYLAWVGWISLAFDLPEVVHVPFLYKLQSCFVFW
ncbi:hypothetical protein QYF36_015185 [Acer negundo]|nr:hypothetical protein QYF36_015185 [Acer negundo]